MLSYKLFSGMSSLSGAKVHIYSIRPHKNRDMTEVLTWMAYPSQSSGIDSFESEKNYFN